MHCFFFYLFIFKKDFIIFGIYEFLKIENRIINITSLNKLFKKLNKFTDINKLYKISHQLSDFHCKNCLSQMNYCTS